MKKSLRNMNAIAREFSKLLRAALTETEMKKVVARNRSKGYIDENLCASHDFCDANMVMDEAFQKVMERPTRPTAKADADLWNGAWTLAKSHDFVVEDIPNPGRRAGVPQRPDRLRELVSEWISSGLVSDPRMVKQAREAMDPPSTHEGDSA